MSRVDVRMLACVVIAIAHAALVASLAACTDDDTSLDAADASGSDPTREDASDADRDEAQGADASSSSADASSGAADAGPTCGLVGDAGPQAGIFGEWYPPSAVPAGQCIAGCSVKFTVNPCCRMPDTPELISYECACVQGSWSCRVVSQGAGYCGDGSAGRYAEDPKCQ